MICTIDSVRFSERIREYESTTNLRKCRWQREKKRKREREREKRDCWRCQVFIRENIIVSERRERGQKRCFSAYAFYETTAARRRLSIGNDFRANVSETRSMINVIRGGRAAMSWERKRKREIDKSRAKKISLENCSLLLAAAIDVPR